MSYRIEFERRAFQQIKKASSSNLQKNNEEDTDFTRESLQTSSAFKSFFKTQKSSRWSFREPIQDSLYLR